MQQSQNFTQLPPEAKRIIIASAIKARMQELNINQSRLATLMGKEKRYISLIIQAKQNMTTETIFEIEKAMRFRLFRSA